MDFPTRALLEINDTLEEAKLKITAIHLEGEASQWYKGFIRIHSMQGRSLSWPENVDVLQAHFCDDLYDDSKL